MLKALLSNIQTPAALWFKRLGTPLAFSFAMSLPWSLTLAYFSLFPLILLWLTAFQTQVRSRLRESREILLPFVFLIAIFLVGSPFGVDPVRSMRAIPATLFFGLTVFPIAEIVRNRGPVTILVGLLLGQSVAALHSVVQAGFPSTVHSLFVGPVTESGQLGITSLLALGLAISIRGIRGSGLTPSAAPLTDSAIRTYLPSGLLLASLLSAISWIGIAYVPAHVSASSCIAGICASPLLLMGFCLVILLSLCASYLPVDFLFRLPSENRFLRTLLLVCLPLLLAALVLNLKRGPWMGVFIGGSLLVLVYQARLIIPLYGFILFSYLGLAPVRERIAEIPAHFFIIGGRSMLWDIGVDLSTRYPLGVGLRNSRFLQTFSEDIPHEINHFHNNFINVTVEGGWLALAVFVWWVVSIVLFSMRRSTFGAWAPLAFSIGCAMISWQVAGLVEYNWGDSEVRILVYLTLGLLLGLRALAAQPAPASPPNA